MTTKTKTKTKTPVTPTLVVADDFNETPAMLAAYEQLAGMDIMDLSQFGQEISSGTTEVSKKLVEGVSANDLDEVGGVITGMLGDLDSLDTADLDPKGGLFGWLINMFVKEKARVTKFKRGFDSVSTSIARAEADLNSQQAILMLNADGMRQLMDATDEQFTMITDYVNAGEKFLAEVRETELPMLRELVANKKGKQINGKRISAERMPSYLSERESLFTMAERRIHDLVLIRQILNMNMTKIGNIRETALNLIQKLNAMQEHTIPLWHQMAAQGFAAVLNRKAAETGNAITERTNELLRKDADIFASSMVESQKAIESSVVGADAIKYAHDTLMKALDETRNIATAAREERANTRKDIANMETELRDKLSAG